MLNKTYFIRGWSEDSKGVKRQHWQITRVPFWNGALEAVRAYKEEIETKFNTALMIETVVRVK